MHRGLDHVLAPKDGQPLLALQHAREVAWGPSKGSTSVALLLCRWHHTPSSPGCTALPSLPSDLQTRAIQQGSNHCVLCPVQLLSVLWNHSPAGPVASCGMQGAARVGARAAWGPGLSQISPCCVSNCPGPTGSFLLLLAPPPKGECHDHYPAQSVTSPISSLKSPGQPSVLL